MLCALRLRLGLPLPHSGTRCEGCNAVLDPFGYHRLACNFAGRAHARHFGLVQGWRQVFVEAGGSVPRRNVERLLRDTPIVVPATDTRRLDLVVPGTGIFRGVPLLCDATCVSPVTRRGFARPGCLTIDGGAVAAATAQCRRDYHEVLSSDAARLLCLGVEVFGRWGTDVLDTVPALARERARGLPRQVRLGTQHRLLRRWWGLLGLSAQRAVARAALRERDADLVDATLEPAPACGDLPLQ